jgi:hypothetical protein
MVGLLVPVVYGQSTSKLQRKLDFNMTAVPTIRNWQQADAFLGAKEFRKLSSIRNTSVERRITGEIAIHYSDTDVVTYFPSGVCELNDGDWLTHTTKERFNTFSPAWVVQRKGKFYLRTVRQAISHVENGRQEYDEIPYYCFMRIDAKGNVLA